MILVKIKNYKILIQYISMIKVMTIVGVLLIFKVFDNFNFLLRYSIFWFNNYSNLNNYFYSESYITLSINLNNILKSSDSGNM